MAAHRKSDRRRDDLYAVGLRKRVANANNMVSLRLSWRLRLKNRAQATPVIRQFESVFVGELRNLLPSIFLIDWPEALQLVLVNSAVSEFGGV
jgi:hypothetical protein